MANQKAIETAQALQLALTHCTFEAKDLLIEFNGYKTGRPQQGRLGLFALAQTLLALQDALESGVQPHTIMPYKVAMSALSQANAAYHREAVSSPRRAAALRYWQNCLACGCKGTLPLVIQNHCQGVLTLPELRAWAAQQAN